MIATARLKYLGVSAQKTRLVVDLVRGKSVGEALASPLYVVSRAITLPSGEDSPQHCTQLRIDEAYCTQLVHVGGSTITSLLGYCEGSSCGKFVSTLAVTALSPTKPASCPMH